MNSWSKYEVLEIKSIVLKHVGLLQRMNKNDSEWYLMVHTYLVKHNVAYLEVLYRQFFSSYWFDIGNWAMCKTN